MSNIESIASGGCTTVPVPGGGEMQLPPGFRTISFDPGTLDVWMIWATDPSDPAGVIWLVDAWDQDTVENNQEGWDEAVEKAWAEHGGGNVRISVTSVDYAALEASFKPVKV